MVSPNKLPIVKSAARHACLQRFSRSGLPNKLPCPHTRFAGQKNNLYNGKG